MPLTAREQTRCGEAATPDASIETAQPQPNGGAEPAVGGAWRRPSPNPFHLRSAPVRRGGHVTVQTNRSSPHPAPPQCSSWTPALALGNAAFASLRKPGRLDFTVQVFHLYCMFNDYGDLSQCTLMQKQAINSMNFQVCILK